MDPWLNGHRSDMPGVDYDGDVAAPSHRSEFVFGAVFAVVVLLALIQGVAFVLVLALVAVLVGLVIGAVMTVSRAGRPEVDQ